MSEMTAKEQELWAEFFDLSLGTSEAADQLIAKARECYASCPKCAKKDAALREALGWIDNECGSSGAAWTADKIREALQ